MGLDPQIASTGGLPGFSFVTTNSQTYGALTFTRVKSATDITYAPSGRCALHFGDWTPLTNVVSVVDNGATETVTLRDFALAATNASRFFQFWSTWELETGGHHHAMKNADHLTLLYLEGNVAKGPEILHRVRSSEFGKEIYFSSDSIAQGAIALALGLMLDAVAFAKILNRDNCFARYK